MNTRLRKPGCDTTMPLLTVLLSLFGIFSSRKTESTLKSKENLKFFVDCIKKGGKKSDCFDSLLINSIHYTKNLLPDRSFQTYQKCIGKVEDEFYKSGFTRISVIASKMEKCLDEAVASSTKVNISWLSIIGIFTISVIAIFVGSWLISRGKSIVDHFRDEITIEFQTIKEFLRVTRENINRINSKVYELEYDNSLCQRVADVETTQLRLQMLIDSTREEFLDKFSYLESVINVSEGKHSEAEKSPIILETKKNGLLFDLTSKEGIAEWKSYVSNNSKNNVATNIPELTPPTMSPLSPELRKVNLFDKNGRPFRRIFVPGFGWMPRKKCIQIMKEMNSTSLENSSSINY